MTHLQALIFDVDGTLAETECQGHRVAFNRTFDEQGLDWHWSEEFYGQLLSIGGGKERIRYFIETYRPSLAKTFHAEDIVRLHRLKNQHYEEILRQGEIGLRPGVLRLFKEAREQDIKLAIATTSSFSNTLALLKYHLGSDAQSWFSVIGAGDIVPRKKPAPDVYDYVLQQLQLQSWQCVVIEDSKVGVTAAYQAGLKVIMTVNSYTKNQMSQGAALVVNHLGDRHHPCQCLSGDCENVQGLVTVETCRRLLDL